MQLANNTRYGLAASVWSENINLALDIAARLKAGVVWVNSTNLFDAAAGFGGYKESGFGREGGREGLYEYLAASLGEGAARGFGQPARRRSRRRRGLPPANALPTIDRTAKLYIGGKQARPDSGYSYTVAGSGGGPVGQAGLGNRKDIRNAVEAAAQGRRLGCARPRTTARRSSTTSPRTSPPGPASSRRGSPR